MFTGIVTDIGSVVTAEQKADLRLTIRCGYDMAGIDLGASICCSGVCLTVVDKGEDWFAVDLSTETLSRTANDLWKQGALLNLERSLRVGDELGGHFLTGHVDCVGDVVDVRPEGGSTRIEISVPDDYSALIAAKGSIALDGVSLTVNDVGAGAGGSTGLTVNIIPHTAEHTTLGKVVAGQQLNVEFDVLARYIDRMIAARAH
jgi:riboflavin synthase